MAAREMERMWQIGVLLKVELTEYDDGVCQFNSPEFDGEREVIYSYRLLEESALDVNAERKKTPELWAFQINLEIRI